MCQLRCTLPFSSLVASSLANGLYSCKFATSLFSSAVVSVEVAPFAADVVNNWTWGRSNLDTYQKLKEQWEKAEREVGVLTPEGQHKLEERIIAGWKNTETCMDVFLETTESMSELVSRVSSGKGMSYPCCP